ncbi:polyprenol monophosphomannose synthase [Clostridium guangxiense]|uniref:polyprenol monophosphomannose synthase n=1 Tax=Clostridium sp. DMHC 10 TaxID=747377 RepID=UPI00069E3957|nr:MULTISPECIES: polyprenol monophosphomannose synthase [Clostridium]KOF56412.1 glycosyl transferase [Clostridium sp. DMHC 10]MCD2345837.1 polyprenol monophosphomannose synthase [Clostridium guangxiense]
MLSIIIPVYNEKKNIRELVIRMENALKSKNYEIIFVDDSNDETTDVIMNLTKQDDKVKLIHREEKRGLSSAVIEGFKEAKGDVFSVMDGDLQHPPEIVPFMLDKINEGADIVIPSRFIQGGSDGGLNLFRKFVSWTARYMGKVLFKKLRQISDPTSGIFMLKKSVIANKNLSDIGWKILIEVLVMGEYNNLVEIPYAFDTRNSGESKMSAVVQAQYLKHLFSLLLRTKFSK